MTGHHHGRLVATPWPGLVASITDSSRSFPRHWHDEFGIGVVERGGHHSASGRGRVTAGPGDVITTNPGEVHDGEALGTQPRRWCIVYLDPAVLASWLDEIGVARPADFELAQPVIRDRVLAAHLARLVDRLAAADDVLASEESLAAVIGRVAQCHGSRAVAPAADANVARVRERLAGDPLTTPTLAALAAEAGIGRFQLLRSFSRAYGLPPHAWLMQWRAAQARRQVAGGSALADAAAACGFADQSHMTRAFVRFFGFTPGALRAARTR